MRREASGGRWAVGPASCTPDTAYCGCATVHFGMPTTADLEAYLDSGEPFSVAGGFTLDGLGGWFVDRIEGNASNVIGLSLPLTGTMLQRVGLSVAELWAANRVTT